VLDLKEQAKLKVQAKLEDKLLKMVPSKSMTKALTLSKPSKVLSLLKLMLALMASSGLLLLMEPSQSADLFLLVVTSSLRYKLQ